MKRSDFSIMYSRLPSAGNGVILAGHSDSAGFTFRRPLTRRIFSGATANYSSSTGAGAFSGQYRNFGFGGNLNIKINEIVAASINVDERQYEVNKGYQRWSSRVSAGLTFHPRGFPIWPR